MSMISYSEKGDSDDELESADEVRPTSPLGHAEVNAASARNITKVDPRRISAVELPYPYPSSSRSNESRGGNWHRPSRSADFPSNRSGPKHLDAHIQGRDRHLSGFTETSDRSRYNSGLSGFSEAPDRARHRSGFSETTLVNGLRDHNSAIELTPYGNPSNPNQMKPSPLSSYNNITKGDIADCEGETPGVKIEQPPRFSVVAPERKTVSYTVGEQLTCSRTEANAD